jgi:hydrogenase-4 component B
MKAGVVPMHFWLPGAHAAAPSHVSAVLSGVMLKMGIYGLLRVLNLLGSPPAWFGWTLFGLGLVSGVLGVLWALGQHDLKRLLAYHSVENIGIILLGMGVGVLGVVYGHPVVALLGFMGALLHTLNHALFKSLLFLGAGAVVRATGTREIDRLGGLARRMPLTALAFGIGSVAIVGLPPLNGFVSEWVVAQGLLRGVQSSMLPALVALGIAGLGLIGGLALACFSRVTGGVFLGRPRGPEAEVRDEPGLVVPMLALAMLCIVLGAYPAIAVRPAVVVVGTIVAGRTDGMTDAGSVVAGALSTLGALGALLAAVVLLLWYLRQRASRFHEPAIGMTWGCAYGRPDSRMQYTASSFSAPMLRAFGAVAAPRVKRDATSLSTDTGDLVLTRVAAPLWERVRAAAEMLRPLQQGRITRYLQYIVLTLVLLLGALFAAIVRRP